MKTTSAIPIQQLQARFGDRLQENVTLANYTTAHVGGAAAAMLVATSAAELETTLRTLWELQAPVYVFGSGSNVLVADSGLEGVVVLNHARTIRVDAHTNPPTVQAESGANFGSVARQVALRAFSGLEWACTIPGTVGGAVYGNAGAYGSEVSKDLVLADILHQKYGKVTWTSEQMGYAYRTSILKQNPRQAVILSAQFKLSLSSVEEVQQRMSGYGDHRRANQPAGASMGSMFKNPPGDYAGRLIEAAGLKGKTIGGAEISSVHANFMINCGNATATDLGKLIQLARNTVYEQTGIRLELEVELLGDWSWLQAL